MTEIVEQARAKAMGTPIAGMMVGNMFHEEMHAVGENPVQGPDSPRNDPTDQPPYGQQPYGQQPPYGQPPLYPGMMPLGSKVETTNVLAVVSLVSAFVVNVVGIITGHIALAQIKRTGEKGRGLAIGGLVVGYVSLASTIILGTLLIIGILASTPSTSSHEPLAPQPSYGAQEMSGTLNAFGGITFGPGGGVFPAAELPGEVDLSQLSMDPAALDEIGIAPSASGEAVQVVVYPDFLCPFCAEFETTNGPALKTLRDQGKITLEYCPLGFLDQLSNGTKYSTRSAEAAACVANNAPTSYERFFDSLFKNQPAEMSAGLDNAVLVGLAQEAGAGDISSCLANRDFAGFVGDSSILAQNYGVAGTPTVFVEGQQWSQGPLSDFTAKALAVKK